MIDVYGKTKRKATRRGRVTCADQVAVEEVRGCSDRIHLAIRQIRRAVTVSKIAVHIRRSRWTGHELPKSVLIKCVQAQIDDALASGTVRLHLTGRQCTYRLNGDDHLQDWTNEHMQGWFASSGRMKH